ncbi:hypothetical protein [Nocardia acidivorans]|uniref:hypothetical protein n=1 Tax=Nocardia acidivorans TaxID=404580 RepID=UPI000A6ABA44|nr:hypothetical protein [Nocardia acidivorans]
MRCSRTAFRAAGFEQYFAELGGLMDAPDTAPAVYDDLAARYGLSYGHPDWLEEIIARYRLNPPTHGTPTVHR